MQVEETPHSTAGSGVPEALTREIERTEALAREYREEGLQLVGPLIQQVRTLLEQLRKHADREEATLVEGDPIAPPHRRHREQCELLESLVSDPGFDTRPPAMIAAHVAAVAGLLRRDFLEAERELRPSGAATTES